jgi:hypothetical protein
MKRALQCVSLFAAFIAGAVGASAKQPAFPDAKLYRARMTRDGKGKPTTVTPPAGDALPPSTAVSLYREFRQDEKAALKRYGAGPWSSSFAI